jgi:hypothetical protein
VGLDLQYFRQNWPDVVFLYRQALSLPEADRSLFLQVRCGLATPVYFEVQALLAATEQRLTITH